MMGLALEASPWIRTRVEQSCNLPRNQSATRPLSKAETHSFNNQLLEKKRPAGFPTGECEVSVSDLLMRR